MSGVIALNIVQVLYTFPLENLALYATQVRHPVRRTDIVRADPSGFGNPI